MAENQEQKTKRELLGERLKTKYPDREYADDEALFGQINDDYDEYDKQIGSYKEREDKLTDMFANDPKSAQFIADMANGKDPWIAVIERIGIDGITDLMNDPSKQAEYAEANKAYLEGLAKEKGLEEEYQKNLAASMEMLDKMQQEKGLSDEIIDAAMEHVLHTVNDVILGKITPETIEMALKAINHDADMANARSEGEVAGRNAKIDEKLRKQQAGDGMPVMGSAGVPVPSPKRKGFFDDLPKRKF